MARRRTADTERAREMMERFAPVIAAMDAAKRVSFESVVNDFIWYDIAISSLEADVTREGFVVDGKENPKVNTLHKMTGRKSTLFGQIMRVLRTEASEEEQTALEAFLGE